jgi:hypothetical protein
MGRIGDYHMGDTTSRKGVASDTTLSYLIHGGLLKMNLILIFLLESVKLHVVDSVGLKM